MNFLRTSTGLTTYRVFLVSICVVSLMIWAEAIKILGIIFMFCLPGILNELFGKPQEHFFTSAKYEAPYRLFVFVWNGFRSRRG